MNRVVITGGLGFIGSTLYQQIRKLYPDAYISVLDKYNYAADHRNLPDDAVWHKVDIAALGNDMNGVMACGQRLNLEAAQSDLREAEYVFHLAASSHVDKSIEGPEVFVNDNVNGTFQLLEYLRKNNKNLKRFIHVSTDEVYGDLPLDSNDAFDEKWPIRPTSPYSSTKASSDLIALSYYKTFKMPVVVTRCSNNFGPRQDKTKLIPKVIKCLRDGLEFPLYNRGLNERDWLPVEDHVGGLIRAALNPNVNGEVFNFGTGFSFSNKTIIELIEVIYKGKLKIKHVEDRLAHDAKYAVDSNKAWRILGWQPTNNAFTALQETVQW